MKENMNPEDARLGALLREARISPTLPPRFQENVWHRIEHVQAPGSAAPDLSWLDALAALVLRPRFVYATVVALMVAGSLWGVRQGAQSARHDAQARYVAMVAPNALR